MRKIKTVIIDNDYKSIILLEEYLNKLQEFEIIAKFTDPLQAVIELQNMKSDLIFLDIETPKLMRIGLIKAISKKRNIILTTAYKNYGAESFELDFLYYLLKPLVFEKFLDAINRFKVRTGINKPLEKIKQEKISEKFSIYVKENYKTIKIKLDDILYIESLGEYVNIVSKDKSVKTKKSLYSFETNLAEHEFIRIHRSYIISLNAITTYTNTTIEIGDKSFPIGRNYRKLVRELFNKLKKKFKLHV